MEQSSNNAHTHTKAHASSREKWDGRAAKWWRAIARRERIKKKENAINDTWTEYALAHGPSLSEWIFQPPTIQCHFPSKLLALILLHYWFIAFQMANINEMSTTGADDKIKTEKKQMKDGRKSEFVWIVREKKTSTTTIALSFELVWNKQTKIWKRMFVVG